MKLGCKHYLADKGTSSIHNDSEILYDKLEESSKSYTSSSILDKPFGIPVKDKDKVCRLDERLANKITEKKFVSSCVDVNSQIF